MPYHRWAARSLPEAFNRLSTPLLIQCEMPGGLPPSLTGCSREICLPVYSERVWTLSLFFPEFDVLSISSETVSQENFATTDNRQRRNRPAQTSPSLNRYWPRVCRPPALRIAAGRPLGPPAALAAFISRIFTVVILIFSRRSPSATTPHCDPTKNHPGWNSPSRTAPGLAEFCSGSLRRAVSPAGLCLPAGQLAYTWELIHRGERS